MVSSATPAATGAVEFDPFSTDFFNSPYGTYRRMRDEAPVYYNSKYDFWALSRYADVAPAYKDFEAYSSARGASLDAVKEANHETHVGNVIIMMDPPEHQRMRKLVSRVFTPLAIASLEPMVYATISRFTEGLKRESFDLVRDFAALFPVEIISAMLGVPGEDRQQIRPWIDDMLRREPGSMYPAPEALPASLATGAFYYELIQRRRAEPQDDMISRLIETEIDEDGEVRRLDDIEITAFASMLGGAGAETVTKLIANAGVIFADNPEQWRKLHQDRSKIPAAVEELLRYEAPAQYNVRYSLKDKTLHGITIPYGSAVMLINGSANRDEREFPDPDRFDIDRERKGGFNLAFGYGIHSCLGSALARMESRIALDTLLDLMPEFEVDRSGLQRVNMMNVCGWSSVPVRALR